VPYLSILIQMHNEEGEHGTRNVVYHRSQQRVRPLHVEQLLQRGDRVDGTARKLEQLDDLKTQ
jgi:hypothetical protein